MPTVKTMWQALSRQSIFVRLVVLVIYEISLFAGITPFLWTFGSAWSFYAALAAAVLCTTSAMIALWIHHFFRDPRSALTAILLGMAVNMGVPLAFGVAIHLCGGPLSESGFLYYLGFFYILTLAMKTVLTLHVSRQTAAGKYFFLETIFKRWLIP